MNLKSKKCVPCEVGGKPLTGEEAAAYLKEVPEWTLTKEKNKISKIYKFKDFKEALKFVNAVGEIAESEGHHPDILINYNKVTLENMTNAVGGLSPNDFILAAKIDSRFTIHDS